MSLMRSQKGETIIEVLIAIMVMSAALAGAFAVSSRSQRTVQSNQERYQAQLIANQQADLIKLAQADDGKKTLLNTYTNSTRVFCMNASGAIESLTVTTALDPQCLVPYGSPKAFDYKVMVQPIQSNPGVGNPVDTFVITIEWDSLSSASGTDNLRLIYAI
jgi:Tfp pilus assembly protein PilV